MSNELGYRLVNRSGKLPEDGWYHVVPEGEFPHPSGFVQVLDQKALEAMVNTFRDEEKDPHFPGLLVDFDHFSNDSKKPSRAAGWIQDLQNRVNQADPSDNGLWAQVDWSVEGKDAVEGKAYRLVSPVWNRGDCEPLGKDRIRPRRLDRIALTNDPNLKGMNPLTNRDQQEEEKADETAAATTRRAAQKPKFLLNYGTSEGAKKGWITRKGGAVARMATKGDLAAKKTAVVETPRPARRAATKADVQKLSLTQAKKKELEATRAYDEAKHNPSDRAAIASAHAKMAAAESESVEAAKRATPAQRRAATKADIKLREKFIGTREGANKKLNDLAKVAHDKGTSAMAEHLNDMGDDDHKAIVKALKLPVGRKGPVTGPLNKYRDAVSGEVMKRHAHAYL